MCTKPKDIIEYFKELGFTTEVFNGIDYFILANGTGIVAELWTDTNAVELYVLEYQGVPSGISCTARELQYPNDEIPNIVNKLSKIKALLTSSNRNETP